MKTYVGIVVVLSAMALGMTPSADCMIPVPGKFACVNVLSYPPIPETDNKNGVVIGTRDWGNSFVFPKRHGSDYRMEWTSGGQSDVFDRVILADDSMKLISKCSCPRSVRLGKIGMTFNDFGGESTTIQYRKRNGYYISSRSRKLCEGWVNNYEQMRAFQIVQSSFGGFRAASGFHPKGDSRYGQNTREARYRVREEPNQEAPDTPKEDMYIAAVLAFVGIVLVMEGGRYLLKPNRTSKRWIIVFVHIVVGIGVLALNLAVIGLRVALGG